MSLFFLIKIDCIVLILPVILLIFMFLCHITLTMINFLQFISLVNHYLTPSKSRAFLVLITLLLISNFMTDYHAIYDALISLLLMHLLTLTNRLFHKNQTYLHVSYLMIDCSFYYLNTRISAHPDSSFFYTVFLFSIIHYYFLIQITPIINYPVISSLSQNTIIKQKY